MKTITIELKVRQVVARLLLEKILSCFRCVVILSALPSNLLLVCSIRGISLLKPCDNAKAFCLSCFVMAISSSDRSSCSARADLSDTAPLVSLSFLLDS